MAQHTQEFAELNAEVICVFREEDQGAKGLEKVVQATRTTFTLAVDQDKKSTMAYSSKRMTFDNFVIDKTGKVRAIIPGTLRDRATGKELIKALKEIEKK